MEIEKIVSTLQEKIGNTDFSSQTIQKAVELYPVADGVEPDEAYFSKVADFLKGMQGQYNHDFSTKFKEAKKNLLTEDTFKDMTAEQLSELKTLIGKIGSVSTDKTNSEEVAALKAEIAKLTERLDNGDVAKRKSDLLQKVRSAMVEQKASDEYVLDKTLEGADIDLEKSLDDLTKDYLAKYDVEYKKCRGVDSSPRMSAGDGSGTDSKLKERFKQKAIKEGWAKD